MSLELEFRARKTPGDCFTNEETEDLIDQKKKKKLHWNCLSARIFSALSVSALSCCGIEILPLSYFYSCLPFSDGDDNDHDNS